MIAILTYLSSHCSSGVIVPQSISKVTQHIMDSKELLERDDQRTQSVSNVSLYLQVKEQILENVQIGSKNIVFTNEKILTIEQSTEKKKEYLYIPYSKVKKF